MFTIQCGIPVGSKSGEAISHRTDVRQQVGLVQLRCRQRELEGSRFQPDLQIGTEVGEPVAVMAETADFVRSLGGRARGSSLVPVQRAGQIQRKHHGQCGAIQARPVLLSQALRQFCPCEASDRNAVQAHVREARVRVGDAVSPVRAAGQSQKEEDCQSNQDQQQALSEVGALFGFVVSHLYVWFM